MQNYALFVKKDLLLQEKGFEQLRECVSSLTDSQLNNMYHYRTIDYFPEIDKVCLSDSHTEDNVYEYEGPNYISHRICNENFILIDFFSLKQFLSL